MIYHLLIFPKIDLAKLKNQVFSKTKSQCDHTLCLVCVAIMKIEKYLLFAFLKIYGANIRFEFRSSHLRCSTKKAVNLLGYCIRIKRVLLLVVKNYVFTTELLDLLTQIF